jgi:hypothetical protein
LAYLPLPLKENQGYKGFNSFEIFCLEERATRCPVGTGLPKEVFRKGFSKVQLAGHLKAIEAVVQRA